MGNNKVMMPTDIFMNNSLWEDIYGLLCDEHTIFSDMGRKAFYSNLSIMRR